MTYLEYPNFFMIPDTDDPLKVLAAWMELAVTEGIAQPDGMVLGTVDSKGAPHSRSVLLKGLDKGELLFFTNYRSPKAMHIESNNMVSLLLPWYAIHRQVVIRGYAKKVGRKESRDYFESRPRGSQISVLASHQSRVIESYQSLKSSHDQLSREHEGRTIPCPAHWGGFRVFPSVVEFWNGKQDRLHLRYQYSRDEGGDWTTSCLAP